jgi:hypothetical protein
MTAPTLAVVAAWDPGLVRGAAGALGAVAARLPGWRSRVEAVGRELEASCCWVGPAAGAAAEAVVELSVVVTAATRACDDSLAPLQRLAGGAGQAQALAAEALALAAAAGVDLGPDGRPVRPVPGPTPAMTPEQADPIVARAAAALRASIVAEDALRLAARAVADAGEAGGALRVRIPPSGLGGVPALPGSRGPDAVATWWAGLSAAARRALIAATPQIVGGLDGLPGWARDRANRLLLGRALADVLAPGHDVAPAVAGMLLQHPDARLFLFAPRAGRVAVALGDVDTAEAVGVLVPGIRTTAADDLGALVQDAGRVAAAARAATPGLAVATVAWLGYRTPERPVEIVSRTDARIGGRLLDDTLDGLAAARAAAGGAAPRTTVLAHSYGTVVLDEAADRPGHLAADAVALLGSPGMERDGAAGLEAPEVYQASGWSDIVPGLRWFGEGAWEPAYGAERLPTDRSEAHGDYYDPAHPTLAALGRVVAGPTRTGEAPAGTAVHPRRSGG